MKQLHCEMCGSTDLVKQDGMYVCQVCGTKYTVEEAKKLMTEQTPETENDNLFKEESPVLNKPDNDAPKPNKELSEKNKKILNISLLVGYIIGIVGVTLFLGIVLVSAIAYGEVYLFDGYDFTKALSIISIIFMQIGLCSVIARLILSFGLKLCEFHKKIVIRILVICLAALCLGFSIWGFVDCGVNSKSSGSSSGSSSTFVSFFTVYAECNCKSPWAEAGIDYLSIDTNPYDYDSDSYLADTYAVSALTAIQKINSRLGLPTYLYQEMIETRALDGRQTYYGSSVNVSWRYHPDSGLEVRYTR